MNSISAQPPEPLTCPCGSAPASRGRRGLWRELLRCQRCGLLVKDHIPPEDELIKWYQEDYWERYRDEQVGTSRHNLYVHALEWLLALAPHPGTLVDVGCGAGTLLALCPQWGWKGIGFDPSSAAVAYAQAKGLEAYRQSWPPCSLADETADAVTFINVLDHLRAPFAALTEAWRVLRPGGLLYIRVPNGPVHARLISLLSVAGLDHLAVIHLYAFGRAAFAHHLPRLGFEVVALRTAPPSQGDAYGHVRSRIADVRRSLRRVNHLAHRLFARLGLDRMGWGLSLEVMACKTARDRKG